MSRPALQLPSQLLVIAQAMAAGAMLLTPNVRAARQWRGRVERFWAGQEDTRKPARVAQVLPWRAWTASLYQQVLLAGMDDRVLMNPVQFAAMWEAVLRSQRRTTLRPVTALARLCGEAHSLLHRFLGVDRLLRTPDIVLKESPEDARQFHRWLREVEHFCAAERLLPADGLEPALANALLCPKNQDGSDSSASETFPRLQLAPHYLLVGFDAMLPAQESLLNAINHAGSRVDRLAALAENPDPAIIAPRLVAAIDSRTEMLAIAQRLRQELEQHDAARQISIVVPDLQASRATLERVLREIVSPDLQDIDAHTPAPWEFSTGVPLAHLPVIAHALLLLRWTHHALPVADVSELVLSPYISLGLSVEAASELDTAILRDTRRLRPEWTASSLAAACQKHAPEAAERLRRWMSGMRDLPQGQRSYADWAASAQNILTAIGWPGERSKNSQEFQTIERWNELLDQITSLDLFGQSVSFPEFVGRVVQWAAVTTFAPENTGAPLQFMTPAESAGTIADVLWCAHADESRWTARQSASPLLPWTLQVELGMPGTDTARDRAGASAVMHRLQSCARELVFSYAVRNEDGDVRASALLGEMEGLFVESAVSVPGEVAPSEVEQIDDSDALPPLPQGTVSGGVGVLKTQAACAFRAFAERRLFATAIDTPDLGLDAAERGNLMHRVLEAFWRETKTHARLLELINRNELQPALLRHIDAMLRTRTEDSWSLAYLRVQRQRLLRLLLRWLEYESRRPPFHVLSTEQRIDGLEIASLRMDVRVDRVDEVEIDGARSLVLIDYKSGSTSVNKWLGERPEEPQLPLYAVAAGVADLRAIAFGSVKAGEKHLGLKSFPPRSSLLTADAVEGDAEAFAAQLEEWQWTLERLATDFANGVATVDPREYPGTCQYCEQRMLCRLNPELLEVPTGNDHSGGQD